MNSLVKPCYKIMERNKLFFDKLTNISQIIILGASYNEMDLPYFKKVKSSILPDAIWEMGWHTENDRNHAGHYQHALEVAEDKIRRFQF